MVKRGNWWGVWLTAVFLLALCQQAFTPLTLAQETPTPAPTPTVDRLAAPPTVPAPTQADEGAQLYWLHCQPCHGDQGQGLTDEWRAQYPEEDRNCWNSGCHGKRPYENGFTLPTAVPAVIGDGALARFESVAGLYAYVRVAMPFEYPGTLSDAEYLAITAHLARAHDVWDGTPLTASNVAQYRLQPAVATATPAAIVVVATATRPVTDSPNTGRSATGLTSAGIWATVGMTCLLTGGVWLWRQRK